MKGYKGWRRFFLQLYNEFYHFIYEVCLKGNKIDFGSRESATLYHDAAALFETYISALPPVLISTRFS